MAGSPVVVDYMQVTITSSFDLSRYQKGQLGYYVFGYVTFGTNGYFEAPQWINFPQQMFFPQNKRFDTFKWQCKPGINFAYKPIYGNLDILGPTVQGYLINMAAGAVQGLSPFSPSGAPLSPPELVPFVP